MATNEPEPITVRDGEPWWNYLYEYDWHGATYTFVIPARSEDEAQARLKRLPLARYKGQGDGAPIPAYPGVGLYVRFLTWVRNLMNERSYP